MRPHTSRDVDIYCTCCRYTAVRGRSILLLPRPVLIISVEVIQHVCLSRARRQTMSISKRWVTQQGLCDANITFTYNTHTHKHRCWCGLVPGSCDVLISILLLTLWDSRL